VLADALIHRRIEGAQLCMWQRVGASVLAGSDSATVQLPNHRGRPGTDAHESLRSPEITERK